MKTLMAKLKVRVVSQEKEVSYMFLLTHGRVQANDWGAMSRKNMRLLVDWSI